MSMSLPPVMTTNGARPHARAGYLRLIALVFAIASLFLLFAASQASAALVYANDEDGANDEPGQKDLTRHGVDVTGLPTSLHVVWNWDSTGWNGNNTGDGCSLIDTDADGKVNYSVCVVIEDDPAVWKETVLYSCGDDKVDRCTSPVTAIPIFSSTCSASVTATDPFPAGESNPNDTTADCTMMMADFGGATNATLVNTCSYPSQQPNSDPSDCVLVPRDGFLIINKVANPDDSNAEFDFTLDGGATPVFTAHGSETSGIIPVKTDSTHSILEEMPDLWGLDSAACSDSSGTLTRRHALRHLDQFRRDRHLHVHQLVRQGVACDFHLRFGFGRRRWRHLRHRHAQSAATTRPARSRSVSTPTISARPRSTARPRRSTATATTTPIITRPSPPAPTTGSPATAATRTTTPSAAPVATSTRVSWSTRPNR